MIRDVTESVQIEDQPRVVASLILDAETGLIRGVSMAPTAEQACAEAVDAALTRPAGPLPPEPPSRIVHRQDDAVVVTDVLVDVRLDTPPAMEGVAEPLGEAEDVFDSLLGHLAGRSQPQDPPTGGDWQHLYDLASRYCRAEPWQRWSDTELLDLEVRTGDHAGRYLAVILGQAGIQRGLALYPGTTTLDTLVDWDPTDRPRAPSGSLLFWLDSVDQVPRDFAAKAERYGWPDELPLIPFPVTVTDGVPSDLGRVAAQHLTIALASVLDLHGRSGDRRITGRLQLAEDAIGSYAIGAHESA
jgi:hypothetical protein